MRLSTGRRSTGLDNLTRWYDGLEQRAAFKQHILPVPFV